MRDNNLFAILKYKGRPVRVGVYNGELILSLSDLRKALGLTAANVTNITKNLPFEVYFRVATINLDGGSSNTTCIAVTKIGAYMALAKMYKVDQVEVKELMSWIDRINVNKLIKGA